MAALQNDQLVLSLLRERLGLSGEQLSRATEVYSSCSRVLESDSNSSASLPVENSEDVWRPCVAWLIKSVPGVLDRQVEQPERGSASPEAQTEPPAGLPLSELLSACHTNLVSFFKELPVVLNKVKPTLLELTGGADDIEQQLQLREWQETLVSLQHISNKYKDLFWHVQRSSPTPKQPLLRAGWLAFLMIKAQLLPGFPDLVSCLELLVCVLNLFLASATYSEAQLVALQSASPAAIEASGKFSTLKVLSLEAKVDYSKTKALMPQIEARFCSLLEEAQFSWLPQPLPASLPHPQADKLETCCRLYLEGLTSKTQLNDLVLSLDESYQKFYMQQGEIDERDFLLNDFGALASPRALPGAALPAAGAAAALATMPGAAAGLGAAAAAAAPASAAAGTAAGVLAGLVQQVAHGGGSSLNPAKPPLAPGALHRKPFSLGLQSPLPLMQLGQPGPSTPISQAMGSVAWLRGLVRDLPLEPPASLKRYMEAAGADAGRVLEERVQAAAAAVFLSDAATGGAGGAVGVLPGQRPFPELQQGVAQERRDEGIKVYWHVLEAMLRAEEGRARLPAACSLLTRWSFHQCLLACSFELVAASYRMGLLSFPAIPAKLALKPFDLSKMIGPFVKAEPTLPRELKRHMFTMEEKILESLGWAPGSSFYRLTRAATGQQQQHPEPAAAGAGKKAEQETEQQQKDANMEESPAGEADAAEKQAEQQPAMNQEEEQQQHEDLATDEQQQQQVGELNAGAAAVPSAAAGSRKRATPSRGSSAASAEPMDTDAAATRPAAAPHKQQQQRAGGSGIDVVPKRQRGEHGGVVSHPHSHESFAAPEPDLPLPRALGVPGSAATAGADASARAVLYDYCRKVLKLAAFRLVAISEGLDFSPMERDDVVAAVHEVLSHALYNHTHLFYSRHLDTLLLASLYGYCKVNRLHQITFREIISHYKRQAHAKQEVFRTVVLQQTDPGLVTQTTGDIIAFYNAVFVPAMKGFLLTTVQQQPGGQAANGSKDAAARRQGSGELATAGDAAAQQSGGPQSPIYTALMHAAQQQQQQQRGWAGMAAGAGAAPTLGAGSAYRALSLAGGPGGGVEGLGFASGGGRGLGGGLGSLAALAAGSGIGAAGFNSSSVSIQGPGGLSFGGFAPGLPDGEGLAWGTEDAGGIGIAAAAVAVAPHSAYGRSLIGSKAAAVPMPAAGGMPSRLSRLSRPSAATGAPQQGFVSAGGQLNPKLHDAFTRLVNAADLRQQQDQGTHAVVVNRHQQGNAAAAAENMECDDAAGTTAAAAAANGHSGSGSSRSGTASPSVSGGSAATGAGSNPSKQQTPQPQQQQPAGGSQQQQQQQRTGAAAGSASPAGLATLMQALDTSSGRAGVQATEGLEPEMPGGLARFSQQQQAVAQDS